MAINMPTPTKSPVDAISDALNLVTTVYGIKVSNDKIEQAKKEFAMREAQEQREKEMFAQNMELTKAKAAREAEEFTDKKQGVVSAADLLKNADSYQVVAPGTKGSLLVKRREGDTLSDVGLLPKQKTGESPLVPKGYVKHVNPETGKIEVVAKSRQLPPDKVLLVNEGNILPESLKEIRDTIDQNQDSFGPIMGRASSLNPYDTKAKTIDAQMRAASQSFGRYMEGGVLRKEDEDKYRKMFPQLSDTPDVASNKLAIVEKMLVDKQRSNLDALQSSGYDTSGLARTFPEAKVPKDIRKSTQESSEGLINKAHAKEGNANFNKKDLEALLWLKQNPTHPKAKAVAERLKQKGL